MTEPTRVQELVDRIGEVFGAYYDDLRELADRCRDVLERVIPAGAPIVPLGTGTTQSLLEASEWFMSRNELTMGAGVIFSPERMSEPGRLIEWWMREPDGTSRRVLFNHRPGESGYYDYQRLPWYSIARDTHGPAIAGPYIDLNGVDEYILTFTWPLELHGEFSGMAGCDVTIDSIERLVMADLRRIPGDLALLHEDRIIAGNSSRFLAGDLVTDVPGDDEVFEVALPVEGVRLLHRARG